MFCLLPVKWGVTEYTQELLLCKEYYCVHPIWWVWLLRRLPRDYQVILQDFYTIIPVLTKNTRFPKTIARIILTIIRSDFLHTVCFYILAATLISPDPGRIHHKVSVVSASLLWRLSPSLPYSRRRLVDCRVCCRHCCIVVFEVPPKRFPNNRPYLYRERFLSD